MAKAIVGSSLKNLAYQQKRLLAAVVIVPILAFLPRTMFDSTLPFLFSSPSLSRFYFTLVVIQLWCLCADFWLLR
jgi:hypothetical protein